MTEERPESGLPGAQLEFCARKLSDMAVDCLRRREWTLTFELRAQNGLNVARVDRIEAPRAKYDLLKSYPSPFS
jgi:hypothetical protein